MRVSSALEAGTVRSCSPLLASVLLSDLVGLGAHLAATALLRSTDGAWPAACVRTHVATLLVDRRFAPKVETGVADALPSLLRG